MKKKAILNVREERDIWQVLNATFAFIGVTFKALYKDVLLISGPFFVVGGIIYSLVTYSAFSGTYIYRSSYLTYYRFLSPVYWLGVIAIMFGWSLACSVIGNHLLQYRLHGPGYDVKEVRRALRKDMSRVFFGNLLNFLIILAASLLFLIPGIYLIVGNSLFTVILILDKRMNTLDAFAESRRLIRDNWWRSLLLGMVVGILTYAVYMVSLVPTYIITVIVALHSTEGRSGSSFQIIFTALGVLSYLALTFVAPIWVVSSGIYYYSLREKKDHIALLEDIDSIGVQPAVVQTETQQDEGDY